MQQHTSKLIMMKRREYLQTAARRDPSVPRQQPQQHNDRAAAGYFLAGYPATTHMVEYMKISKYPVRHDVKIDSNNFPSIPKLSFFFPEYCS